MGDDLFVDFVHPNLRAHQLIAATVADALRAAAVPAPPERWVLGRYVDPDPEGLYRADPALRTQEQLVRAVVGSRAGTPARRRSAYARGRGWIR